MSNVEMSKAYNWMLRSMDVSEGLVLKLSKLNLFRNDTMNLYVPIPHTIKMITLGSELGKK